MKNVLFFAKFFGIIFAMAVVILVADATVAPGLVDIMAGRIR